jgi:hypothetical protein
MPLPPEIITKDIHSFVTTLFDSLVDKPSLLQKDSNELCGMFASMYYPLTGPQQFELDACISQELTRRFDEYDTAISVHPNFRILKHKGTYYKMDKDSESGYFVTTKNWYIVEEYKDNWEMYPTYPRLILENNGITRIYE